MSRMPRAPTCYSALPSSVQPPPKGLAPTRAERAKRVRAFERICRFFPVLKDLSRSPLELSEIGSVIRRRKEELEKRGGIAWAVHSDTTAPLKMSQEQT